MSLAPPRPRALFPLEASVEGGTVVVCVPARIFRRRGLLAIFPVPLLLWVLAFLIGMRFDIRSEVGETALVYGATALSSAAAVFGVVLLAYAARWSRRSRIVIDCSLRRVRREIDSFSVSFDEISQVRVRRQLRRSTALDLVGTNGEPLLVLHARLPEPERDGGDVDALAAFLTACFVPGTYRHGQSVAAVETVTPRTYLFSSKTAAMLCYLPLLGPNIYLQRHISATDERPEVVFAARQGLMHTVGAMLVFLGAAIFLGVPSACLQGSLAHGPLLAAFLVVVAIDLAAWCGGTIIAFVQAGRGRAWMMPWLRPFANRLPPLPR